MRPPARLPKGRPINIIPLMRPLLLCLALLLLPQGAAAYKYDARLSAKLKKEFEAVLRATETGRGLQARLAKEPGYASLRVLARKDPSESLAWFDFEANAVYLNSRFILKFFEAKKFSDAKVVEILSGNKEVRSELVKYAAPVYLHELVHAAQCYLYPEYRQDAGGNPLEFEYEAYLTEHMYIHETMKASSETLRGFISGAYSDVYTANILGGYFMLSLDPEKYREKIRRRYEEQVGGYLSMRAAAEARQAGLADSRILAYASGEVGSYIKDNKALERLKKQREAYAAALDEFYRARWPGFSSEALLFVGSIALEEKNYPLALDCLAVADANAARYGIPEETLVPLKTRGALAILETASFLRDNSARLDTETLSQHLKALEKACAATARPFPEDLLGLKAAAYLKAISYYSGRYAAEKDPARRDYYKENLDYFAAGAGALPGGE